MVEQAPRYGFGEGLDALLAWLFSNEDHIELWRWYAVLVSQQT